MLADLVYLQEEENVLSVVIGKKESLRFNHPNVDYAHFICTEYGATKKLLKPFIINGERTVKARRLQDIQQHAKGEIAALHPTFKRLLNPHVYKVSISDGLKALKTKLIDACCQE